MSHVPELRFSEFASLRLSSGQATGSAQVLGEWEEKNLKELTVLITKGTTPKKFVRKGVTYIKIESFEGESINIKKCLFIDPVIHAGSLRRSILMEGDILFAIAGATIGKCSIVKKEILPANTNQALSIVRLKKNISKIFIYNKMISSTMKKYIVDNIAVGAQPNLNLEQMGGFSFFIPQLPEQQKIATFLSAVDKKLGHLHRKHELLESYKRGIMQKIFSQELRFKQDNGADFPDWEEKRLGDVFEEIKEKIGTEKIETYSITAGKGFISQKKKFGKDISGRQNVNYTKLKPFEFSYNKGNSKTFKYGCVYLNEEGKTISVPNVFISFKLLNTDMDMKFFAHLFNSHYLDRSLRRIISSSARMDGLLNVNKKNFFNLNIIVPPNKEQQKVANFLSTLDKKLEAVQKQIDQTESFKKGLLQKMFV